MRDKGYYWVKDSGEWIIANWDGDAWIIFGYQGTVGDVGFDEINECRIERLDSLLLKQRNSPGTD